MCGERVWAECAEAVCADSEGSKADIGVAKRVDLANRDHAMAASLASLACGVAAPLRVPEVASAAYSANYGTATEVDNAAYSSQEFWDVVEGAIPGFADDLSLIHI